jgi:hypothetical protein
MTISGLVVCHKLTKTHLGEEDTNDTQQQLWRMTTTQEMAKFVLLWGLLKLVQHFNDPYQITWKQWRIYSVLRGGNAPPAPIKKIVLESKISPYRN